MTPEVTPMSDPTPWQVAERLRHYEWCSSDHPTDESCPPRRLCGRCGSRTANAVLCGSCLRATIPPGPSGE